MTIKRYLHGSFGTPGTEHPKGPFVSFSDHEHALAEKDADWKRRVGLDCRSHSCMFAIEKTGMRTNGRCQCNPKRLQEDHDKLYARFEDQALELERLKGELGKQKEETERILRLKGYIERELRGYGTPEEEIAKVLATPAATALQQAKDSQ